MYPWGHLWKTQSVTLLTYQPTFKHHFHVFFTIHSTLFPYRSSGFFFSLNMTNFSKSLFLCIWGFLHPVNTQVKTFLCFQFKFNCSLSVEPRPGPEVNDTLPEAPIYVMDVSIVLCCLLDFLSSPDCGQLKGMEQALFIFLRIPLILSWMLNI